MYFSQVPSRAHGVISIHPARRQMLQSPCLEVLHSPTIACGKHFNSSAWHATTSTCCRWERRFQMDEKLW